MREKDQFSSTPGLVTKQPSGLVKLNFHVYGFHPPFEEDLVRKSLERSIKTNLSIFLFASFFATVPSSQNLCFSAILVGQIGQAAMHTD